MNLLLSLLLSLSLLYWALVCSWTAAEGCVGVAVDRATMGVVSVAPDLLFPTEASCKVDANSLVLRCDGLTLDLLVVAIDSVVCVAGLSLVCVANLVVVSEVVMVGVREVGLVTNSVAAEVFEVTGGSLLNVDVWVGVGVSVCDGDFPGVVSAVLVE